MPQLLANAEAAALAVTKKAVRDGLIMPSTAKTVRTFAVAYGVKWLTDLRTSGVPAEEIARALETRRYNAYQGTRQAPRLAVDIYIAIWAGMQADLEAFTAR